MGTKQNPKAKRSSKSKPIGYKNAKIPSKQVTGGKTGVTLKQRGGMGSARPNYGKTNRTGAIPGIGGR